MLGGARREQVSMRMCRDSARVPSGRRLRLTAMFSRRGGMWELRKLRRRTIPFEEKMERLTAKLEEQFAAGARLEAEIRDNLKGLGYRL
jgi:hypothetical protein